MKTFSVLALCVALIAGAGCTRPQKYIDMTCGNMSGETLLDREAAIQCQQFKQDEAATAVYNEATLLMKSYGACLEKYEQAPARAREYCGQYGKALQDIGTCGKIRGETLRDREAAIQCQHLRQEEAATAVYNEATLLLKSYRACLEKYEKAPARAREYCAQYGKALQDIGLQIKETPDALAPVRDETGVTPKPKY